MIRDRNIDPNAAIATSKLEAGGLALLIGPVFGVNGIRYVDSLHANSGDTKAHGAKGQPFNTLGYALTLAAVRDAFIVGPGHTENVVSAADIDMNIAGVQVFGFGQGEYMPTFTLKDSTAATFKISASGCRVHGLRFIAGYANIVRAIEVIDDSFRVDNCEFVQYVPGAKDILVGIDLTHIDADNGQILNNYFIASTAGATSAIEISSSIEVLEIARNVILGNWSNACIYSAASPSLLYIHDNHLHNLVGSAHAIEFTQSPTGLIINNLVQTQVTAGGSTDSIHIGSCGSVQNFATDADADKSGKLTPPTT